MMFSTNPFASSIHVFPSPNSFLDHEKDDVHTNVVNPFASGDCCFHSRSPPPAAEKFTTNEQDSVEGLGLENSCEGYNNLFASEKVSLTKKNKPSKKDHHCKIHTAQGPRDRRVRLSIEVARKFFNLQDILGFDKASKTIDWLFTKSKISICELIKGKKQPEVVFMETVKEGSNEHETCQKVKSATKCVEGKRKKTTRKYKSGFLVNQSRVEARARARERTKERLHLKNLCNNEYVKKVHADHCSCCGRSSGIEALLQNQHSNKAF